MATTPEMESAAAPARPPYLVVAAIGMTQIIGWGTTFTPLSIIGTDIARDLAFAREEVFLGLTVMLIVSALLAPHFGRLVDRAGARPVMMAGSLIAAAGHLAMAYASGRITYFLAWAIAGIAMPMMLSNAALPGLVQVIGPNARRALTGLMLVSGLTSTIFMPLIAWLGGWIGWRSTYLVFAVMHVAICLPVHWFILRRTRASNPTGSSKGAAPSATQDGLLPADQRGRAFACLALWSCTEGLITWGLYVQVIDVFKALGLSSATAIGIWALVGPSQALARLAELIFGGRYSILTTALASALLTSGSFLILLPFGVGVASATVFSVCLGVGHGLFAIARNTLPLTLFGAREFGSWMGRLMVPQNLVNAAAPVIFAFALERLGPAAGLWIAAVAAFSGLAAVAALTRAVRGREV